MRVFLMGMPGCGKTTFGKKLANKISLPFFDLDEEITKCQNSSIETIFKDQGENFFRQQETILLNKIIREEKNFVLALGGGTPSFHDNITLILSSGISIYLSLPLTTLLQRIRQGNEERPLFQKLSDSQKEQKMFELLQIREPFYLQANFRVNAMNLQIDDLINQIHLFFSH